MSHVEKFILPSEWMSDRLRVPHTPEPEQGTHISQEYNEALQIYRRPADITKESESKPEPASFSPEHVDTIHNGWNYAPLPHLPGQQIGYVRLDQVPNRTAYVDRPVFYVGGLMEGVVAKAPFALELAECGFDVILPDQNRTGIVNSPRGKKDSILTLAMNQLAIIAAEGLQRTDLDVVAKSLGSMVFEQMIDLADKLGWTCFKDSDVVLLAPSGVIQNESRRRIALAFAKEFWTTRPGKNTEAIEVGRKEMDVAGNAHARANLGRTYRDIRETASRKIGMTQISEKVGSLLVMAHRDDALFPMDLYDQAMCEHLGLRYHPDYDTGIAYAVPISYSPGTKLFPRPSIDLNWASHNDDQFWPYRDAAAVAQALRHGIPGERFK